MTPPKGQHQKNILDAVFICFIIFYIAKEAMPLTIKITPTHAVANVGESVRILCEVDHTLDSCFFKVNDNMSFISQPGKEKKGMRYVGKGLEEGHCGIEFLKITEDFNGNISCAVVLGGDDGSERSQNMKMVVTIPPKQPKLEVDIDTGENSKVYKEKETLIATCIVPDARPAANITWYLGNETVTEGLQQPEIQCDYTTKEQLCTIQQKLTRPIQASDDKKILMCVAQHQALKGELLAKFNIKVNYRPKPASGPVEKFGLIEGAPAKIPVEIEANPQPQIQWSIGGETIDEESNIKRYSVGPTLQKAPGVYETVLTINPLLKEDMEKDYVITAHNKLGEEKYTVSISTSPPPEGLEMGIVALLVILIIIGLLLIVVFLVVYLRAKGKLCFSDGDSPRMVAESSDTESADQAAIHRIINLNLKSVFKKNSEKATTDKGMLEAKSTDQLSDEGESVVYAELELGGHRAGSAATVVVRGDDDKTEYAEIIHTQPPNK